LPEFATNFTGKTVGIIGSGPAGLACATFLLRAGVKPVVYEKADEAGGLLTYGIPGFKLEKSSVQRRLKTLLDAGMELHLNTEIGKDISFQALQEKHDSLFIGIGAMAGKVLDNESYNTDNIYMAVPFLTNIQKKLEERTFDKKYDVAGKSVLVIGGGDTAMDCVRTSVRQSAKSVKCVYRRDEENMPGSRKEVKAAKEEGVEFIYHTTPKNFVADDAGKVLGMKFANTELQAVEGSERAKVVEVPQSEHIIEADVVILALGFNNEKLKFFVENNIALEPWGAIKVDEYGETSVPNVFAGGDATRGADLVVTAALDGREIALKMLERILD